MSSRKKLCPCRSSRSSAGPARRSSSTKPLVGAPEADIGGTGGHSPWAALGGRTRAPPALPLLLPATGAPCQPGRPPLPPREPSAAPQGALRRPAAPQSMPAARPGAGRATGMGRLLALEFAQRRATLVLWDVDSEGNENTAREVRELGVRAYAYTCDVSRREEVYAAAGKVRRDVGDVTILVNNASIVAGKPILQCPDDLLERTMRTNCHAHFWTVKAFLPQMIKKGHGHIITIAGSLGLFATGCMEGYCASKFAVVGFHEALSHELKAKRVNGVKTTLVCPYLGDSGLSGCFGIRQELEAMTSPVNPGCCVKSAMQGILRNQHMICVPRVMYLAMISKNFLPWDIQVLVQKFLGLDKYIPQKEANCTTGR